MERARRGVQAPHGEAVLEIPGKSRFFFEENHYGYTSIGHMKVSVWIINLEDSMIQIDIVGY